MTKQEWKDIAQLLLASRFMDEHEEQELVPAGKITYQFSSKGHELAQIVLAKVLSRESQHDGATVYYRSRPFVLASGMTLVEGFAGPLGKSGSRNNGRDIGVVHNLPPRIGITILPTSGDVGAQYTPAIGWAQAAQYRANVLQEKEWERAVGIALGGDGSCATNGFWSALTIATTLKLPMIFFIEDNGYGISVTSDLQTPGGNIADNLASFKGLEIIQADGTNPIDCSEAIEKAVSHARSGKGAVLCRLTVPRLNGHSGADNQAYKPSELVQQEMANDPLVKLQKYFIKKKICTEKEWNQLAETTRLQVIDAAKEALQQPEPIAQTARNHVFYDGKSAKVGGLMAENIVLQSGTEILAEEGGRINLIEGVKRTLEYEISSNPRVLVFGEDVGVKGGVHGATVGMQTKFGSSRVFDTSLSEEGIIGRAVGMAMAGLMPVPEIQFRKYADPATEQINDCGTIRWRTNGDFSAPIVVRIPVGYGKRTGDPWHSVSGEAIYAHTIGWKIAIPSNTRDAVGLLRTALRGNDPTMFFEHRALLDQRPSRAAYPGDNYSLPFGKANCVRTGNQVTIVTWGEMLYRALEAVEKSGIDAEVIDLRTIIPWDKEAVLSSVRKTNRVLVLHEDTFTNGFGAEIAATIAQEAFRWLDAPVERLATFDCPIPYNPILMNDVVPSVEIIADKLQSIVRF